MKLIKKIVFLLIVVFITSCEKDSDSEMNDIRILGTWKLISDVSDAIATYRSKTCAHATETRRPSSSR